MEQWTTACLDTFPVLFLSLATDLCLMSKLLFDPNIPHYMKWRVFKTNADKRTGLVLL